MSKLFFFVFTLAVAVGSAAQATTFNGVMDDRAGFPNVPGFTAQSQAWIVGGSRGEGLRLEWQADDVTTPGFWTYTYKLLRGTARNKGFAFFDIETAADFTAANLISRQVLSATDRLGNPIPLSGITISDPVAFTAPHDFSNASVSETNIATVLDKTDLSHYSGDPGRTPPGQPGGTASATPSEGPKAHPFYGIRVTFPGSFANTAYVASDWEFRIVTDRVPMWGNFFGWGDQTTVAPFWYANFYNDAIDAPNRLTLAPANSLTGSDPYRGWILVPGPLPAVIASNPADTAPGVPAAEIPLNEPVTVVFGGLMDPATITTNSFSLSKLSNGSVSVPGSVSYDAASRTATFTPDQPLAAATTYGATITSAARDLAGNPLPQSKFWSFSTTAADHTPPSITTLLPDNGARHVPTDSRVSALFSEELDPATLSPSTFRLTDNSGALNGTLAYSAATRTATFTPAPPLANNTVYTATITSGVTDRSGNHLAADRVWSFSTIPQETVLPLITATVPADLAGTVSVNNPLTATFSEAMDPATINASSFSIAGVSGAVGFDAVNRVAKFTPDLPLLNSTTYTATISTAVKDLAGNGLPLTKIWSFTTGPPDSVPPTVTATQPSAGASNVAPLTSLSVVFSERINPTSIGPASFTLIGQSFESSAPVTVSGTIFYNDFSTSAQFSPTTPLARGTRYSARISTAVTDLAGNALAADTSWSFSTQPDGMFFPGESSSTVADALKALRIAVNLIQPTPFDLSHGDVAPLGADGTPQPDGSIGIQDALLILRKVVGLVNW